MQRLLRFLMVGGLGAIVNLACFTGVYYSLVGITGSSAAYGMAFTPRGDVLAAGDAEGRITLWSLPQGREFATLRASRAKVCTGAASPPCCATVACRRRRGTSATHRATPPWRGRRRPRRPP